MSFIKNIINKDQKIELYKFDGSTLPEPILNYNYDEECTKVCFLDLETTGLNKNEDKIVEIGIKLAAIDKKTNKLVGILDSYQSFQDPHQSIDTNVMKISGITNEMVEGKQIDWDIVESIFNNSEIIVAHNASFDRAFMDRYLSLSKDKIWACSVNDIDWTGKGFSSKSQEMLCIWHGFYFESHRAMSDVDALIHLLTHPTYNKNAPIKELIENAYKPIYKVYAVNAAFEKKDILKANKYYWNSVQKYWWKNIDFKNIIEEKNWLTQNVYDDSFNGTIIEVPIEEKYKNE